MADSPFPVHFLFRPRISFESFSPGALLDASSLLEVSYVFFSYRD